MAWSLIITEFLHAPYNYSYQVAPGGNSRVKLKVNCFLLHTRVFNLQITIGYSYQIEYSREVQSCEYSIFIYINLVSRLYVCPLLACIRPHDYRVVLAKLKLCKKTWNSFWRRAVTLNLSKKLPKGGHSKRMTYIFYHI